MKILLLSLCFFSSVTFGAVSQSISVEEKLSPAQIAELEIKAHEMLKEAGPTTPTTPAQVKEWTDLVTAIGDGFVNTSQKLGIAVNQFVQTPVGIMTALVLIWNYMGNSIVHMLFSIGWFMLMIPLWIYFFRKHALIEDIKYVTDETTKKSTKTVTYKDLTDIPGVAGWYAFFLALICFVGLVTAFAY